CDLSAPPYGDARSLCMSPLASRKLSAIDPNFMLKSPLGLTCTCWRTLPLQTRSIVTSCGTGVPSSVATCPVRNITSASGVWRGCEIGGIVELLGGAEGGAEGGGPGDGFCANAPGPRNPIASASSTKMRRREFTDSIPKEGTAGFM